MREQAAGGVAVAETISKHDFAAQTENPKLWVRKYDFYVDELGFTQQEAIRWANRTVCVDAEIRQALKLNGNSS